MHTAGGARRAAHLSTNVHRTFNESIPKKKVSLIEHCSQVQRRYEGQGRTDAVDRMKAECVDVSSDYHVPKNAKNFFLASSSTYFDSVQSVSVKRSRSGCQTHASF